MPHLELILFGAPRIIAGGQTVALSERKPMALLAYLAVSGAMHERDHLATLFWPDHDQRRARANLRYVLWLLRKCLGKEWWAVEQERVGLKRTSSLTIDVLRFQALVGQTLAGQTSNLSATPLNADEARDLRQAVTLYHTDFLAGFTLTDSAAFDEWQFFQGEGLRAQLIRVLEKLLDYHTERDELDAALEVASRWLAADPHHEPVHRCLMRLYAKRGQWAAALRQYDECIRLLAEELDTQPDDETAALHAAIKTKQYPARVEDRPAQAPVGPFWPNGVRASAEQRQPRRHNLPPTFTPFIGREEELAQIATRLTATTCRLLTVVGPGGMGKSRLVIEAATAHVEHFRDGICFVVLTSIESPTLLAPTIMQALGIPSVGPEAADSQLINYLRDRRLLLILDNYEQLLPHTILLSDILNNAAGVKLLITSRERLNLHEEWLLPLEGMALPPDDWRNRRGLDTDGGSLTSQGAPSHRDVTDLEKYSAVRFFVECVRRLQPGFSLDSATVGSVVRICNVLDGMPLGIELAAGWMRAMPLSTIAKEMAQNLAFLSTPLRNLPDRHRSLQVVFDHSLRLLSSPERSALLQLSVFQGGFTAPAAQAVADADFSILLELVDRSWLRHAPTGRYEMHELMRQFAAHKLETEHRHAAHVTPAAVRDRHSAYFGQFLHETAKNPSANEWTEFEPEVGNIWAAWRWAAERADLQVLDKCLDGLAFMQLGDLGFHAMEQACAAAAVLLNARQQQGTVDPEFRNILARILGQRANSLSKLDRLEAAIALCEQSLALLTERDTDTRQKATGTQIKLHLAYMCVSQGNYLGAQQLAHEALADCRQSANQGGCGNALHYLGISALFRGDYSQAERFWTEMLAGHDNPPPDVVDSYLENASRTLCEQGDYARAKELRQELQARLATSHTRMTGLSHISNLMSTGDLMVALGEYTQAKKQYELGLSIGQTSGYGIARIRALNGLGAVALATGKPLAARQHFSASLAICQDARRYREMAIALCGLGEVACMEGEYAQSRHYFDRGLHTLRDIPAHPVRLSILRGLAGLLIRLDAIADAVDLLALVVHHPATSGLDRDKAARQLSELETAFPANVADAALTLGRSNDLDEVVTTLLAQDECQCMREAWGNYSAFATDD